MSARLGSTRRLFLLSLLLLVVVGGLLAGLLESGIQQIIGSQRESELQEKALAVEAARRLMPDRSPDALADEMGAALGGRVTLIEASGVVIGDSWRTPEQLAVMDNHRDRPEVVMAQRSGVGISRRHSDTVSQDMLYVAVPMHEGAGVVRISMPRRSMLLLDRQLLGLLLLSALMGIGIAAAMSFLANRWVARDLQRIILKTQSLAEGSAPVVLGGQGLVGSVRQLADALERTVRDLAVERDRLGAVLEGLGEAVIALDSEQRITLVNPAAVSLLGISASPHGQRLSERIAHDGLSALIAEVLSGASRTDELDLQVGARRKPIQVLITAAPQRQGGGCLLVCRDVTALRRLERIRRDFVANVSHELRTPVAVIRINAETLLDGAITDPVHGPRFVDGIFRNAERLSRLLTDLLDISQLEAGRYQLSTASYRLAPAAAQAIAQLHHKAEERQQDVRLEIPPGLRARCDLPALEQVLTNLLDNAIKYCPPGSRIVLRATPQTDQIRLEVSDNGPGISSPHLARLFERFYRVDPGRSRDMGGTGLGLSIVRHLIESMGGLVGVRSVVGEGTTFWVLLPTKKTHTATAAP